MKSPKGIVKKIIGHGFTIILIRIMFLTLLCKCVMYLSEITKVKSRFKFKTDILLLDALTVKTEFFCLLKQKIEIGKSTRIVKRRR